MFTAALFIRLRKQKSPKCTSVYEGINQTWYNATSWSTIRHKKEWRTDTCYVSGTLWVPEDMLIQDVNHKRPRFTIPFMWRFITEICRDGEQISDCSELEEKAGRKAERWKLILRRYKYPKTNCWWVYLSVNIPKTTELCTLNELTVWHVNAISKLSFVCLFEWQTKKTSKSYLEAEKELKGNSRAQDRQAPLLHPCSYTS